MWAAPAWIAAINLLAVALFGIDKRRAVAGEWRIPEATLLWVALLGGSPGAKFAQRRFRHKTRKQPFARSLNAILALHLALLLALLSPQVRAALTALAQAILP